MFVCVLEALCADLDDSVGEQLLVLVCCELIWEDSEVLVHPDRDEELRRGDLLVRDLEETLCDV